MRIVVFGTGLYYLKRKTELPGETKIIAFLDNDRELQGRLMDGISVYAPSRISELDYDMIVLASASSAAMKEQLLSLGISENRIMFWEQFISSRSHGILVKFQAENIEIMRKSTKVLLIVPAVNYGGGFLAGLYAAMGLKSKGCHVVITAPVVDHRTVREVNDCGIDVWACPSLPYIEESELRWIQAFDFIFVNSLQNMICVDRLCGNKPVIWWLHENRDQYEDIVGQYGKDINIEHLTKTEIFAVSSLAKKNFKEFYPEISLDQLLFGIPDFYNETVDRDRDKIIIAVIGTVTPRKNQTELIRAIKKLSCHEQNQIECWIIGLDGQRKYREQLDKTINDLSQIKMCGEFSRKEMERVFPQLDIIVCSSLEETMSIAVIEGMMNKKICIASNKTGIADFIRNGENGFVYESGNENDLLIKLKYVIQNFQALDFMKDKARDTYEKNFSMEKFSDRLYCIIQNL